MECTQTQKYGGTSILNSSLYNLFLLLGFSKVPDCLPDLAHTYFGIAALSLSRIDGVLPMFPALNVSVQVWERMKKECVFWK